MHFAASGTRPLVIVHGLFGSSRNWGTIARRIAVEWDIPVYALDIRNHNVTSKHALVGPVESWNTLTRDLESFVQTHMQAESFSLLGHSLGGQICLAAMLNGQSCLRERVSKLAIVDISLRHPMGSEARPACNEKHASVDAFPSDSMHQLMRVMQEIDMSRLTSRDAVVRRLREVEREQMVVDFLMTNVERDSVTDQYAFRRLALGHIADSWEMLRTSWPAMKQTFVPWSGRTVFIKGAQSRYICETRGDEKEIKRLLPHAEIKTVPHAGHWPHFDNQPEFLRVLGDFLRK